MKTEFLVPFELDTSAIEQKMQAEGYDEAVSRIVENAMKELKKVLPNRYGSINWDMVLSIYVHKWLDDHTEEIIDTTALLLAKKIGNKRRWRDVLEDVKKEMKEE